VAPKSQVGGAKHLLDARRVVIKIGSSLFVDQSSGTLDRAWLAALCSDVSAMRKAGQEVVIVSSGSIALGAGQLGLASDRMRLEESQASAAVGQIQLAHAYQEELGLKDLAAAQVLLTLDDSESRRRYLNAEGTLLTLLSRGAIPVVNENDTVATEEIRYGDNDRLAAHVAQMLSADCLIILSDVDGLYTSDPKADQQARHIPEITDLKHDYWDMAGGPGSAQGTGGMRTKLDAARIALGAGCRVVITSGRVKEPIRELLDGGRATWFMPTSTPKAARKQWIAGTLKPKGALTVDDGAQRALLSGKSLLPAGVLAVEGDFGRGEVVQILGHDGTELGRGLTAYTSSETRSIAGCQSGAINGILGYCRQDEIIHRNDLVLTQDKIGL